MNKRKSWSSGLAGALLLTAAVTACSKPAQPSGDLARDLNAAAANGGSAPALTLAPTSGRRDVVSAIEQSPDAHRAAAAPKLKSGAQRSEVTPPPSAKEPQPVVATPTTAIAAAPPAAAPTAAEPTPSPRPTQMQPAHTGRYKTEAEVIRDAPFPIKP